MPVALSDIMCTLIPSRAPIARPIAALSSLIAAPTTATIARSRSTETSPSCDRSTTSDSSPEGSSTVTETDISEVATTSTEIPFLSKISNTRLRKPRASSIFAAATFTSVMPDLPAIALTARRGASKVMRVPFPFGLREL